MADGLLRFYGERVKKSWKTAFFSALLIGLFAHAYKFTNLLLNHDALFFTYSRQNTVGTGRWLLTLACGLSGYFDLPWVNGLLALLWIGLTAAVVAELFGIEDPAALALEAGILVSFPCVTNTFFFEFAADGYMLAMLLAALAAYFARFEERRVSRAVLAGLCLCLSCGIYQAYVSFALMLTICTLLTELLCGARSEKECLRWVGRQLLIYAGGMLAFWLVWKLCLRLEQVEVTGYQGVDKLGQISLLSLLAALKETARTLTRFFLGWDIFTYGLTGYAVMNLLLFAALLAALVCAATGSGLFRRPGRLLLALLCLAAMPIAVCCWLYLSPSVGYHALMLQSLSVLYVFTLFLCARVYPRRMKTLAALFFAVLVFRFSLNANASYYKMERCMERSRADAIEMLTRVHQLDDGSVRRIAFLGGGDVSLVSEQDPEIRELPVNAHQLRSTLLYDNLYASLYLQKILNCPYTKAEEGEIRALLESGLAEEMDVWPGRDSVRVVGDTAVIRLPDRENAFVNY